MGKYNDWIKLGIFFIIIGLGLSIYSINSYNDISSLKKQIDFDLIDDNIELSNTEKYYKYLSFADFLNQKLDKNKNLPIKNSSCIYLDYAEHNALEMYFITKKFINNETSRKDAAAGNIRTLYNKLPSYNTCKNAALYRQELEKIITEIETAEKSKTTNGDVIDKVLREYRERQLIGTQPQENLEEQLTPEQLSDRENPAPQTADQNPQTQESPQTVINEEIPLRQ